MSIKILIAVSVSILLGLIQCVQAGVAPTISVASTSAIYLNLADKMASGVLNDPTDPLAKLGINFQLTDEDVSSVVLTCSSSKTSVVPNNTANMVLSGSGNVRNLKIIPKAVGYATITITAKDAEGKTATYKLYYAASASAINPSKNYFHTHLSSASTAIALDATYMCVGDDEYNELSIYNRAQSGMPVAKYDPTTKLNLPDKTTTEVDIEASCKSPTIANRSYWIGSMSNSKDGDQKPNRDRIFAMDIAGPATSDLKFVGYGAFRADIITWGDAHGYNLTASTKTGVIPKAINGFSLEGLEFGPDNTTLFLGFRTPFVPANNRTKALICPVLNFESWFNKGVPSGKPTFGVPIELSLGGRGIRSIGKNATNQYIIVAGAFDGEEDFAVYYWTGFASDTPVLWSTDLTGLNPEGIVEVPATLANEANIELVNDHGSVDWYKDETESKDLTTFEFQKFAATWLTIKSPITTALQDENEIETSFLPYPNPALDQMSFGYHSLKNGNIEIKILDKNGKQIKSSVCAVVEGSNRLEINVGDLKSGNYILSVSGNIVINYSFIKR